MRNVEGATTPPIIPAWEGVTTPPIPSSSPGYAADTMDISPLPHKVPFSFLQPIEVQSPTPEPSPDEDMVSPCEAIPNNAFTLQERPLEYAVVPTNMFADLELTRDQTKAIRLPSTVLHPS